MKNHSYVAPCLKKAKKNEAVTFGLIIGGIILAMGGIGNGTSDLNILVILAGLLISGLGASRVVRP
ncbi:MAG: hypothetical protein UW27_C0002G0001 [Parcubacteria group bacterium GW2011_GWA1_44_13]|uniref:Uncharacterized protein n=1 Tax=Candidatus Nomurabacteria bacterium GW2011_GWB1_44_12 TaxID=1618748 RepID=A0A837I7X8_9BACT|nr:MAG: hypothetical protein UW17_C0004G0014 [Candidatus Nomurabacteria bacterium GW2011_GWD1_44_10]KKT37055.1 MAG: hypothetical protein UW25_C0002G0001 [Candidatus Nomurabacteria bacterium GW2011_GWB1_44_12]KKT38351.1 MAG: hypothetical protein UW27_C0002G0001 [Parcubacteria group bacterium GW2011_GWA1_44_13]